VSNCCFHAWLLHKAGLSAPGLTIWGMAQNFIVCDREQELLLPPSLREWLPEGHLAWFVIDAVAQLDLAAFYAGYRADGHGRAAHDPAMMVAVLLYAYAIGERSSRRIERRCVEDVATRGLLAFCLEKGRVLHEIERAESSSPRVERLEDDLRIVALVEVDRDDIKQAVEAGLQRL
jgi:hypothetical protein